MGSAGSGDHTRYDITWKDLPVWQRKIFHRENESRIRRGLKALSKLSVNRHKYNNGGY